MNYVAAIFGLALYMSLSVNAIVYTRWGKLTCAGDADPVYTGYAASAHFQHTGSGKNYICLSDKPEWGKITAGVQGNSQLYGSQYGINKGNEPFSLTNFPGSDPLLFPVACVSCNSPNQNLVTISGQRSCPDGWFMEYNGYLVSLMQQASEWLCVDNEPEPRGSKYGAWQAHFHTAEVFCGTLPCSLYPTGNEISCVVCST